MSILDNAVLVGNSRCVTWDAFLMWAVDRTQPYLQSESAPKDILHEIAARLDSLVTTEGVLESRLGRTSLTPGVIQSVSTACGAEPYEYDDMFYYASPPPDIQQIFGLSASAPATSMQCQFCGDMGFRGSDYCLHCDKPRVLLVYCECGGSTRWAWFYRFGCRNQLNNPPCSVSSPAEITVGKYSITPTTKHTASLRAQTIRLAALRVRQASKPRARGPLPPPLGRAFIVSAQEAAIVQSGLESEHVCLVRSPPIP